LITVHSYEYKKGKKVVDEVEGVWARMIESRRRQFIYKSPLNFHACGLFLQTSHSPKKAIKPPAQKAWERGAGGRRRGSRVRFIFPKERNSKREIKGKKGEIIVDDKIEIKTDKI